VSRFGIPQQITTDQGRQLESALFRQLSNIAGAVHLKTSAYHPSANGTSERFHRQLKSAIRCHNAQQWVDVLPTTPMGFRAALKDSSHPSRARIRRATTPSRRVPLPHQRPHPQCHPFHLQTQRTLSRPEPSTSSTPWYVACLHLQGLGIIISCFRPP
jgi:hypothetical protein